MSDSKQRLAKILVDRGLTSYVAYAEAMSIDDFSRILRKVVNDCVNDLADHITESQLDKVVLFYEDKELITEIDAMMLVMTVYLNNRLLQFFMGGESQLDKELEKRNLLKEMGLE